MAKSPVVILYDANGVAMAVEDGVAIPANTRGLIMAGSDGANARFVRTATDGTVRVDPTGTTTQPVSAASLPLPSGAATEATLATLLTLAGFQARINTLGQKASSDSTPVVLASDQSAVPVTFTQAGARTGVSASYITLGGSTAGILRVMRATTYTEPSSAAQRSIASSNANDTAAGTGARTVEITYYDNSGNGPYTETVTLNGTTPVDTVASNIRFIEQMEVLTVGSTGANAGTITLYGSTGGAGGAIGSIGYASLIPAFGDRKTLWAHHYVATGWTVETATFSVAIQSGGSGTSGKFLLRHTHPLITDSAETLIDGVALVNSSNDRVYTFHTKIEGFIRLTAYVIPSVNNTEIAASFDWSEIQS